MRAVCVRCGCEMQTAKNGHVVELTGVNGFSQLYEGDRWRCPRCTTEVVIGIAPSPYSTNHNPDHAKRVEAALGDDYTCVGEPR